MRHKIRGRRLNRNGAHRAAMFRNLCRALVRTYDREVAGAAATEGRIRTTLEKAKEARPFVERLVTVAVKAKRCAEAAEKLASPHARNTDEYKKWRATPEGQAWLQAQAKFTQRQRQLFDVLRDRDIVDALIEDIAPKFDGRPGGYMRIVRVARRRLADGARLAYLEFVSEPMRLAASK